MWQALLGGAFLLTILTWAWLGFIRPPTYGQYNAKRFGQTLYRIILNGSPTELAVIADELAHSAQALVNMPPTGTACRTVSVLSVKKSSRRTFRR